MPLPGAACASRSSTGAAQRSPHPTAHTGDALWVKMKETRAAPPPPRRGMSASLGWAEPRTRPSRNKASFSNGSAGPPPCALSSTVSSQPHSFTGESRSPSALPPDSGWMTAPASAGDKAAALHSAFPAACWELADLLSQPDEDSGDGCHREPRRL